MRLLPPRFLRPGRIDPRPAGEGKPGRLNHVSLGTVCHTASALREIGLRRWSGPFDWVFSTPRMVADCIRNDFAAFLDPADLRSVPASELSAGSARQCRHPAFEARYGVPILFNHHDPAGSRQDRAALTRAVERLRTVLMGDTRNVLYVTAVDYELPDSEVQALAEALASLPSCNRLVLVTVHQHQDGQRETSRAPVDGLGLPALAIRVRSGSAWRGLGFVDRADDALFNGALLAAADEPASPERHLS